MATLTTSLQISSNDVSSDALLISLADTLTVTNPTVGVSRLTITTADDQEIVDEAVSGVYYLYVKNTDATNFIILQTTASVQYARLGPGEFCFFPVNDGAGVEARADTASCLLEYAYWKKA